MNFNNVRLYATERRAHPSHDGYGRLENLKWTDDVQNYLVFTAYENCPAENKAYKTNIDHLQLNVPFLNHYYDPKFDQIKRRFGRTFGRTFGGFYRTGSVWPNRVFG